MKSLLILLSTLLAVSLYSQVTIGMGEAPVGGALLQLKETESNNTNANKGLGLPRVKLTSETNLYPMFASNPDDDIPTPNEMYNDPTKKKNKMTCISVLWFIT